MFGPPAGRTDGVEGLPPPRPGRARYVPFTLRRSVIATCAYSG